MVSIENGTRMAKKLFCFKKRLLSSSNWVQFDLKIFVQKNFDLNGFGHHAAAI